MNTKIRHPWTAFAIILVISALMADYGEVRGAAILVGLFVGIMVYRMITAPRPPDVD